MENKKSYIAIIIILLLYFITVFILYGIGFFNKNISYMVFSDNTILQIEKNKYEFISDNENKNDDVFNKKFQVYDYIKYLGEYNVKFGDNTYKVYDNEYNLVRFQNNFIAVYSDDNKLKLNTNEIEKLNDSDKIVLNRILKEKNIANYTSLAVSEKRKINNKNMENTYIYNVSNNDYITDDKDVFSIVYVSDGNDYSIINISNTTNEDSYNMPSYYIEAIVDIDFDGTEEIIINKLLSSQNGIPLKSVYKYQKNEYKELINTETTQ